VEGLLIGAIVGSTDAAAVFALLHARGLALKQRTSATLEIESGANDPMAIFITVALVELLASGATGIEASVLVSLVQQLGIGAFAGLGGGWLLAALINRLRLAASLYPLLALSGALLVFALAQALGGSGFLAIYLVGILLGNRPLQASQNILRFQDGIAWLSQIGMFLILGLLVTPSALLPILPAALGVAFTLMLFARTLAVLIALAPFRFPWRDQIFIGWVGLRGAVPIILALFPLLAGLPNSGLYFNIAFVVVLTSLLVQGWTLAPVARRLGLQVPGEEARLRRVELDLPGELDYELVSYALDAVSHARGLRGAELHLPKGVAMAGVLRAGALLTEPESVELDAGDSVLLLARPGDLETLDRLFGPDAQSERLREAEFFGEFALDAEARVDDLAAAYGFAIPEGAGRASLGALLAQAFARRPVIGDRIDLGQVQLVVREMVGERITKVGLKLAGK
jgi:cell volume regulation protein A